LGVDEPREERANRQPLDVAGVDAGQQWLGEIGHRFAAESPPDEATDRLVALVAAPGSPQLRSHPQLAGPREETRPNERAERRRNAEDGRGRERMQPSSALNVGEPWFSRGHEPIAEPELLAQPDRPGFLREQGVGPGVDREAVDLLAEDDAAGARGAFQDREPDAARVQLVAGRKAGDASADDD